MVNLLREGIGNLKLGKGKEMKNEKCKVKNAKCERKRT
jgi:hypothetical protein